MENGEANLESKFAGLAVNDSKSSSNRDGLLQVMKTVEAAEATIKQQVDENNRLRAELQRKIQELEKYKSGDLKVQPFNPANHLGDSMHVPPPDNQAVFGFDNQIEGLSTSLGNSSGPDSYNTIILHKDLDEHLTMQGHSGSHHVSSKVNGTMDVLAGGQVAMKNSGFSQHSSPSMTSFSTRRYHSEGEFHQPRNLSEQGQMSLDELNNSKNLKQDLALKIQEHEEAILHLRKHLSEYSVKEAQIRNEKYVLEKRIAYMRMAFEQQQQDLIDAASKAISYRQDIIEENIRLTYALQASQQERSTFVSYLMPILAEYALQPHVADAQTIVSYVKVLFRHMQEKLLAIEAKLKESQYQIAPWHSDVNTMNFSPSPTHSSGIKNGLELVPQPPYSTGKMLTSLDPQTSRDWDLLGHKSVLGGGVVKNAESDDLGRYSPLGIRDYEKQELSVHPASVGVSVPAHKKDETSVKQVTFKDFVSSDMDDSDLDVAQNDREQAVNSTSKSSAYKTNIEDPSTSYSPYLPPVLEEPTSSFSEAGDDDPLPAIDGLQISGDAFPGRELQACGYSINGTTSCNFEWVRHSEDGSFNYIDGAKQPLYLITADDVDTYLAIEVQPLDNRKRKGELVKVFANEHRKISCDPGMQNCIETTLYSGHASYKVSLSVLSKGYEIWEPAALTIKRDSYNIKCSGPSGIVVSEKFSSSTNVSIPYGSPGEFSIVDNQGMERLLRVENNSNDVSSSRDTVVLVLRIFVARAIEKKKGKKRGLFFNK